MKNKNGIRRQLKVARGRDTGAGDGSLERVIYSYALLAERGQLTLKSWTNLPHEAWHAPDFQARVKALLEEFRTGGTEMALIALTRAADPASGLRLLPLEGLNRRMFFRRHPYRALSVVATFADRPDGQAAPEPRVYVGTAVGGHGFCADGESLSSHHSEVQA